MRVSVNRGPALLGIALFLHLISYVLPSVRGITGSGMGHGGARTTPARDVSGFWVVAALSFGSQEEGSIAALPAVGAALAFYTAAIATWLSRRSERRRGVCVRLATLAALLAVVSVPLLWWAGMSVLGGRWVWLASFVALLLSAASVGDMRAVALPLPAPVLIAAAAALMVGGIAIQGWWADRDARDRVRQIPRSSTAFVVEAIRGGVGGVPATHGKLLEVTGTSSRLERDELVLLREARFESGPADLRIVVTVGRSLAVAHVSARAAFPRDGSAGTWSPDGGRPDRAFVEIRISHPDWTPSLYEALDAPASSPPPSGASVPR